MPATDLHSELLASLAPLGQQHLLQFWPELSPAQQQNLATQIRQIEPAVLHQLQAQGKANVSASAERDHWGQLANQAESPPAIRLNAPAANFSPKQALAAGEAALQAGEVGMILVAGGLGTRLGFDQPKGMYPLGPVSGRSLFQIILDRLLAVGQRYGSPIPLYVMTSPATDEVTRQFFTDNQNFGLAADLVRIFSQATMWALDNRWEKILLAAKDSLFLGPDGHGGMLSALEKSGGLAHAQQRGLKTFFYGQIDNPLLQVCDPLLIGSHLLAQSEMTTQVVSKRHPLERVGNVIAVAGRVQVIEYSDLPEPAARQTNPDGSLKIWAGNLAVHLLDRSFLQRAAASADSLPFHIAHKKVSVLDSTGNLIEPTQPNAIRFEKFIFDLLPLAQRALVIESDPADSFAPVKNAAGEATDTAATAQAAMLAQAKRLLAEAGFEVNEGVRIEINPRFALDASELQRKLPSQTTFQNDAYLV